MTYVVHVPVTGVCFDQTEEGRPFTDETYLWLEANAGPQVHEPHDVDLARGWCVGSSYKVVAMHFHSKDVATLFKLTWGGK